MQASGRGLNSSRQRSREATRKLIPAFCSLSRYVVPPRRPAGVKTPPLPSCSCILLLSSRRVRAAWTSIMGVATYPGNQTGTIRHPSDELAWHHSLLHHPPADRTCSSQPTHPLSCDPAAPLNLLRPGMSPHRWNGGWGDGCVSHACHIVSLDNRTDLTIPFGGQGCSLPQEGRRV